MRQVLHSVLKRLVRTGTLTVHWPDGGCDRYGGGAPAACIALRDARTVRRVASDPGLCFGEAYMDGGLMPVGCNIYDVLDVLLGNIGQDISHPLMGAWEQVRGATRLLRQLNRRPAARRHVAHHYDLDERLYRLFLDQDMQYSCAYFAHESETLEQAQLAKKHHIAAKLDLRRPGLSVLDIGCGWGGMALTLAGDFGARVTGITLSEAQLRTCRDRAAAAGLDDRVTFRLRDYRDEDGVFDRIVSVGMLEHVGIANYRAYFDAVRRCLAPDGVALIHTIGRSQGPGNTARWLEKYIFPGGYSPALSELAPHFERPDLVLTDVEVLRLHYARTIRLWRERFSRNRDVIASLYDERFCRMFEFYLAGAELTFRHEGHVNFQLQFSRSVQVPALTRDYMLQPVAVRAGYAGAQQESASF
jgi:cyclopropane-fatty-acyl-phospholipid synthase